MKTKQQQRRSLASYVLAACLLVGLTTGIIILVDPRTSGQTRAGGIAILAGTVWLAYIAGRWRST